MTQDNQGSIADDEFFLESWVVIQTDPRDKRSTRVNTTHAAVMPPVTTAVPQSPADHNAPSVPYPSRRRLEDLQPRTTTVRKTFSSEQQVQEDEAHQKDVPSSAKQDQPQEKTASLSEATSSDEDNRSPGPGAAVGGVPAREVISIAKAKKKKLSTRKPSRARDQYSAAAPEPQPNHKTAGTESVVLSFPALQTRPSEKTSTNEQSKSESQENDTTQPSYVEWFREKFLHSRWTTGFFTFYLHWILIILLAVLIVHGPDRNGKHSISASMTPPANFETIPFEKLDTRAPENSESSAAAPVQSVLTMADIMNTESLTPGDVAIPELAGGDAVSVDEGEAAAPANFPPVFVPPSAITQGSFTVWTEPEYPEPGHSYRIVIQVRVPEKFHGGYPVLDLEGAVVGSDGYRKLIPGSQLGKLPVIGGFARISVPIVSADAEVRDTVLVRSKMLRENQKLVIEF